MLADELPLQRLHILSSNLQMLSEEESANKRKEMDRLSAIRNLVRQLHLNHMDELSNLSKIEVYHHYKIINLFIQR